MAQIGWRYQNTTGHNMGIHYLSDGTWIVAKVGNPAATNTHFYYSEDQGETWTECSYSGTKPNANTGWSNLWIDEDDNFHIIGREGSETGDYYFATYSAGVLTFSAALELTGSFGSPNSICGFPDPAGGGGWVAFIHINNTGTADTTYWRVDITSGGTPSFGVIDQPCLAAPRDNIDPIATASSQFGGVVYAHTGDGKTAAASPHVYFLGREGLASATQAEICFRRLQWTGSAWSFDTQVDIDCGHGDSVYVPWRSVEWDGTNFTIFHASPGASWSTQELKGLTFTAAAPGSWSEITGIPDLPGSDGIVFANPGYDSDGNIYIWATSLDRIYVIKWYRSADKWTAWKRVHTEGSGGLLTASHFAFQARPGAYDQWPSPGTVPLMHLTTPSHPTIPYYFGTAPWPFDKLESKGGVLGLGG